MNPDNPNSGGMWEVDRQGRKGWRANSQIHPQRSSTNGSL
jgi:hypothetical protein